ncbi:MAG: cytosine permease [Actinomycetota bacterium]|nr:cytosine permease [Actinomycetota bacterium]
MATQVADAPGRGTIEERSIDWVPEDARHGKLWHQAPLWFLGNFQYFSIPIGFIGPSLGLSLGWTILAGGMGLAIGTLFMALHASQGPNLGLPQMVQSRAQFGYRGVVVPLFATLFTYLAFNVADQVLMASGLNAAFGWNADVVAIAIAVLAAVIAIYGHDWVHRAFRTVLVFSLPLMTIVTVGIIFGLAHGKASGHPLGFTIVGFMAQLSAAAAYNITYAPYVSDYSRYLPRTTSQRTIITSVFAGASSAAFWLIAVGAFLAIRLGATDGLLGIKTAGNNIFHPLGSLTAFFLAAGLAATMGMNAYGGMLSLLTGISSVRSVSFGRRARIVTIVALTVVWYAVGKAVTGSAVNTVLTSLTLMLYLLVPWTATNLVDYFFVRRAHYAIADLFTPNGIYGRWGRNGLIAYAVGFLAEIPFMVLPDIAGTSFNGPIADQISNVDISWVVGLIVAGAVYWLLSRSTNVAAELETAREEHPGAGPVIT